MLPEGTRARVHDAFDLLVSAEDPALVLFANPVLLRSDVLEFIADQAHPDQADAVEWLHQAATALDGDPEQFEVGSGPIERLWEEVEQGGISPETALIRAQSLVVTEHLVSSYVSQLFSTLQVSATVHATWRQSRTRGEILLAALAASGRLDDPSLDLAAGLGRIRWTHGLLISVPDGRLLREADEAGERLLRRPEQPRVVGALEFALAGMWGDPYTSGRTAATIEKQQETWELRGVAENTVKDGRPREEWAMPTIADALNTSLAHWRAARVARPNSLATTVGFAEAATYWSRFSGEPMPADALEAIEEGLRLPSTNVVIEQRLLGMAHLHDVTREHDDGSGVAALLVDSDSLTARLETEAAPSVLRAFHRMVGSDPLGALQLADSHRELLQDNRRVTEQAFRGFAQNLIMILNELYGLPEAADTSGTAQEFTTRATSIVDSLGRAADRSDELPTTTVDGAVLLRLAMSALPSGAERTGLAILRLVPDVSPYFAERYDWLRQLVLAELQMGEGVNCYEGHQLSEAIQWYTASLETWLALKREEPVLDLLGRLQSLAGKADEDAAVYLIGSLAELGPRLAGFSDISSLLVDAVNRRLLGGLLAREGASGEVIWAALQFAKGQQTAVLLQQGLGHSLASDVTIAKLLERLSAPHLAVASRSALRAAFERRRKEIQLGGARPVGLLAQDETVSAIDGRTVLINSWTIVQADGSARIAYVVSPEDATVASTGVLDPADDGVPVWPYGVYELLESYRTEGKDHLCLITESELADFAWHTLPLGEEAYLADHWTVTLLPHPHLLFESRTGPRVLRQSPLPVLSIGLNDAGGDYEVLPNAHTEATAVKELYQATATVGSAAVALTGADAVREDFLRLAPTARRIHVATHGAPDPDAPSFHGLVFADGELPAWQVSELDLRQVDLVTLSACDSAELTGTTGDNLQGLPMAFLTAGARTVIGTNAPIRTDASEMFFVEFHRQLAAGTTDLRDAFRAAQQLTRSRFPDPGVWGAFYLLGDWR